MRVAATKQLPAKTAAAERTIMAVSLITNQTEPRFLRGTTASSHAELYVISNEQNCQLCIRSNEIDIGFRRSSFGLSPKSPVIVGGKAQLTRCTLPCQHAAASSVWSFTCQQICCAGLCSILKTSLARTATNSNCGTRTCKKSYIYLILNAAAF